MNKLQNKIDFVVLVTASMANANGDPLNGNRPRTNLDNLGEMSDVCIKRKMRNRMQDMNNKIFVQSADRRDPDDHYGSLQDRAESEIGTLKGKKTSKKEKSKKTGEENEGISKEEYAKIACEKYIDVRSFGQVFAFKSGEDEETSGEGVSVGIRGPVSIHQAVTIDPIFIESMQITKSVDGTPDKNKSRASDTMGMKHFVRFGLYKIKGSINVQLAEKTGFSEDDAETVKECLRTLFVNDASAARPDGSMEVYKLYWFKHNCKDGQYSSAKVHRSVRVERKNEDKIPDSIDDYVITLDKPDDLEVEIIDGI